MSSYQQQPREWKRRLASQHSEAEALELLEQLHAETGLSKTTLKVCVARGLVTAKGIEEFLSPKFEHLTNPFTIRDMDRATARLSEARAQKQKIRVFGDYDVDGTTAAALLTWVFREMGFDFSATQPDRFKDGYGLNTRAVEDAAKDGVRVLITVDCGITSFDQAQRAKELGVDLIIVDHHQLDAVRGLPAAFAVINPQRRDCESGLRQLCGCGLAFYLSMALRSAGRKEGWFAEPGAAEPNLKQHLDLVVMATAADMVPLLGDNHILVRHGLEVLKHTKKPGIKALLEASGMGTRELSPGSLGFVIGPRINASGRMQSASLALELLTTLDQGRAASLANELENLNSERAQIQNQIWDEVRKRIEKGLAEGKFKHGIFVADSAWHEGVVGIVASRVTETFQKPAAVVALRDGSGKGSVRSYGGKDVLSALREIAPFLLGFGGHKHAAGLAVSPEQVEAAALAFDEAIGKIAEDLSLKPLLIEGSCSIDDLNVRTLQELEKLGPFGPGNPEPVFILKASVKERRILKGRHLKLNLSPVGNQVHAKSGRPLQLEAIWFHAAEREELLSDDLMSEVSEWAGVPELNRFRGQITPTLRVRDWRRISPV